MEQDTAGETIALELTAPVQGGAMLARLEGQVAFVQGGLPGETVEVARPAPKRGYLEATALRVTGQPAPQREAPPCPYFGENGHARGSIAAPPSEPGPVCGGCQYQHAGYQAQLGFKRQVLADVLRRVGKILEPPIAAMHPSPAPYNYRNKATWQVTPEGRLAYREARSHTSVPIDVCYLLTPPLLAILEAVSAASGEIGLAGLLTGLDARVLTAPDGALTGALMLDLAPSASRAEAEALAGALLELCPVVRGVAGVRGSEAEVYLLAGQPRLEARFLSETMTLSPTTFFQVNQPVAEAIAAHVLLQCGTLAGKELLDAYCGAGTFTLMLARQAESVIGLELDETAIADLRDSLQRTGLENVTLLPGDAAASLKAVLPGTVGCLLVDPPRSGCSPAVLAQLARIKAPRLVYVSCDVATLARDLRVLLDRGYELETIQPFDLFPQTAHIESVTTLRLPRKFQKRR